MNRKLIFKVVGKLFKGLVKGFPKQRVLSNLGQIVEYQYPIRMGGEESERFREVMGDFLETAPREVRKAIEMGSYVLSDKEIFEGLHQINSPKMAALLMASRIPLLPRLDGKKQNEYAPPLSREPSSLKDFPKYFEKDSRDLPKKGYDVVVVGSGPGGIGTATALLRKNPKLRVLVLEEGKEYSSQEMLELNPAELFTQTYNKGGATVAYGGGITEVIGVLTGKIVGGTARINSGTFERVPEKVLEKIIQEVFEGKADKFEECNEIIRRDYKVKRTEKEILNYTQKRFLELAAKADYKARTLDGAREGCEGRGNCYLGCLIGAKKTPANIWLPEILSLGEVYVLGGAEARKILIKGGSALGIKVRLGDKVEEFGVKDKGIVVNAGGTVGGAELLMRSGIKTGNNLQFHSVMEAYRLNPDLVYANQGLPQGIMVDLGEGAVAEGAHIGRGTWGLIAPGLVGKNLVEYIKKYPRLEIMGAMIADSEESKGKVGRIRGKTYLRYNLSKKDKLRLREAVKKIFKIWKTDEGNDYFFRINSWPRFESGDKRYREMEEEGWCHKKYLEQFLDYLLDIKVYAQTFTFHLFGTNREVIEDFSTGKVKGISNLFVTDASALERTVVNPQDTIYTVAYGKGQRLGEKFFDKGV